MKENPPAADAYATTLEIALVTLIRLQPLNVRKAFIFSFLKNVEIFQDGALATSCSAVWIHNLKKHADDLLQLVEESGHDDIYDS